MPNFVKIGQSVAKILRFFSFFMMAAAAILDCRIHKILLTDRVRTAQTHVLNFIKIGHSIAAILRFCKFSKWRPPPSWIFEILNFYLLTVSGGPRRITVPNFVKIGRSVAEILRFFDFSRWRPSAILDLFVAYLDNPQWYLGVSITLQNLVMIDAVVFII